MAQYGTKEIASAGREVRVSADGCPEWKAGGITIDWSTVTAVPSDTTIPNSGQVIKAGDKYVRYGQVMCEITASGKFGPYLAAATDGRQTLTPGKCFVMDSTHALSDDGEWASCIEGGKVFLARMTDIAANPSEANILTAFSNFFYVR